MVAINSKNDICNMTLSHLGNYGTVSDIDTPQNNKEIVFALWYDITRKATLALLMPNFALARKRVSRAVLTPVFGYKYAYEYPLDCVKLLGINNLDEKEYDYSKEGNYIWTDELYEDGMPIRYVKNITDVTAMTDEFKIELALELVPHVALPITQDAQKSDMIIRQLPALRASLSAINAQENKPIRISHSKFKQARQFTPRTNPRKL